MGALPSVFGGYVFSVGLSDRLTLSWARPTQPIEKRSLRIG